MFAEERYEKILQLVNLNGAVTVSELTEVLSASEATIRRDITLLAGAGKINKVFGGATKVKGEFSSFENDINSKLGLQVKEKEAIAKYCAGLISDDDFVYLDAGSSTLKMIEYLSGSKATFVTSGLSQAKKLMELDLKALVIGGSLKKRTDAIVGVLACEAISKFNFTKAFMGTNGVSIECGFTTPDVEEGITKATAVRMAREVFFLVDSTKIGKIFPTKIAGISDGTIVTDAISEEKYKNYTTIKEVLS